MSLLATIAWVSIAVAFACALWIAGDEVRHPPGDGDHERRMARDGALLQRVRGVGLLQPGAQKDETRDAGTFDVQGTRSG